MCLILCAHRPSPALELVVAANRDEFHARPALVAGFWPDQPQLLAGRDQQMGGAWLGVSKSGRFAAVTNVREAAAPEPLPPRSRGELPVNYLVGSQSAQDYLASIAPLGTEYRGFNLLLWEQGAFWHHSNQGAGKGGKPLPPGYHGLSNQGLNCDWPKVAEGRTKLEALLQSQQDPKQLIEPLFALLMDEGDARDHSASFIRAEEYGTRAATLVILSTGGEVYFEERSFAPAGKPTGAQRHHFTQT